MLNQGVCDTSHSLNYLKGSFSGDYIRTTTGVIKWDTRSSYIIAHMRTEVVFRRVISSDSVAGYGADSAPVERMQNIRGPPNISQPRPI